jgi:hypothetical protein
MVKRRISEKIILINCFLVVSEGVGASAGAGAHTCALLNIVRHVGADIIRPIVFRSRRSKILRSVIARNNFCMSADRANRKS